MTDKAKEVISLYVQGIVKDNASQFENVLFQGVTSEMDKDQILAKMILNSISLSADLTTQIILDILENNNLISISSDEKLLQKLSLKMRTDISEN